MRHVIFDSAQSMDRSLKKSERLYNADHRLIIYNEGDKTRMFCLDSDQNRAFLDKRELPTMSNSTLHNNNKQLLNNIYCLTGWNIV